MKSTKWTKHHRSKYEFPTKVVKNGTTGTLVVGSAGAKKSVEAFLGRPLKPGAVTKSTRYQWVFCEPI